MGFSSGTTSGGNSGALFLGSGKATGGRGGLVEITVGDGDTGTGGYVMISGGRTTATSLSGGNVYIRPGQGPTTGGVTALQSADGTTVLQVTDSTVTIATGSLTVDTSSETRIEAASTITLDANSGILLGGSKVSGYEYDTCIVSGTSCSLNKQTGIITSATSSLAAGASETISLSNDRIVATGAVFVTVQNRCTHGYIMVASVETSSSDGEAEIVVTNIGTYACSSTYKLAFFVVSPGT